jgi:hypothetical protein
MQAIPGALDDDRLVDTFYVCKALGISERLAIQMRQRGNGPPWLRVGERRGQIRYPIKALREWIAEQMRSPGRAA